MDAIQSLYSFYNDNSYWINPAVKSGISAISHMLMSSYEPNEDAIDV